MIINIGSKKSMHVGSYILDNGVTAVSQISSLGTCAQIILKDGCKRQTSTSTTIDGNKSVNVVAGDVIAQAIHIGDEVMYTAAVIVAAKQGTVVLAELHDADNDMVIRKNSGVIVHACNIVMAGGDYTV